MKLLIVEDEPSIATALADSLRLEGYDVHVVGDGVSAERLALAERFDLILLDLMLPKRDGLTVCRTLRSAGPHTPIIVVTARAQEMDKIVGLELGADDYVTKPFSLGELSARIRAVLRHAAPSPGRARQTPRAGPTGRSTWTSVAQKSPPPACRWRSRPRSSGCCERSHSTGAKCCRSIA
jgi:two-component system alkaline phosphatase synthesis response regulator PhoP